MLLMVGLGVGFALMAHAHAEQLRTQDYPEYAGRSPVGPIALLFIGLALGLAFAFPLLRVREWITTPARRCMRIADVFGAWPGVFLLLAFGSSIAQRMGTPLGDATAWLAFIAFVCLIPLAMLSALLAFYYLSEDKASWLDLLGCAAALANGVLVFVSLASL